MHQINTIYQIPCECEKLYVYSQSKNELEKRLARHVQTFTTREMLKKTFTAAHAPAKAAGHDECTALVIHVRDTKHKFNFDNTKVLEQEQYLFRRLIKENLQICVHDTVNKRCDIESISHSYASMLKQLKENKEKTNRRCK